MKICRRFFFKRKKAQPLAKTHENKTLLGALCNFADNINDEIKQLKKGKIKKPEGIGLYEKILFAQ